jgi:hypothetical protein
MWPVLSVARTPNPSFAEQESGQCQCQLDREAQWGGLVDLLEKAQISRMVLTLTTIRQGRLQLPLQQKPG